MRAAPFTAAVYAICRIIPPAINPAARENEFYFSVAGFNSMIRSIVGTSLRLRYIVILLAAGMMVYGITQMPQHADRRLPGIRPGRGL